MTLQLIREHGFSRGFFSARSVMGLLSDVYPTAADEIGKIHLIADERVSTTKEYFMIIYVQFIYCRDLSSYSINF